MNRVRYLALPLTPLYRVAVRARAMAYEKGWKRSHRFPVPVVSVGNITFGGTGKTPTVIALVRDLIRRKRCPAVLTRGYGRTATDPMLLLGPNPHADPARAGDEPLELASRLPGVPIIVDHDRVRGGQRALELGVDVLVLDDGFQHLQVARDLNLVLLDNGDPWGGGHLPPRGRLREPLDALARANAVLVTKVSPEATAPPAEIVRRVHATAPSLPVFAARLGALRIRTPSGDRTPEALRGQRVFAIAGVGRPGGFLDVLEQMGAVVVGTRWFADHHVFRVGEVRDVLERSRALDATVVATAKDAVKLPGDSTVWTIEVSMHNLTGSWDELWQTAPGVFG